MVVHSAHKLGDEPLIDASGISMQWGKTWPRVIARVWYIENKYLRTNDTFKGPDYEKEISWYRKLMSGNRQAVKDALQMEGFAPRFKYVNRQNKSYPYDNDFEWFWDNISIVVKRSHEGASLLHNPELKEYDFTVDDIYIKDFKERIQSGRPIDDLVLSKAAEISKRSDPDEEGYAAAIKDIIQNHNLYSELNLQLLDLSMRFDDESNPIRREFQSGSNQNSREWVFDFSRLAKIIRGRQGILDRIICTIYYKMKNDNTQHEQTIRQLNDYEPGDLFPDMLSEAQRDKFYHDLEATLSDNRQLFFEILEQIAEDGKLCNLMQMTEEDLEYDPKLVPLFFNTFHERTSPMSVEEKKMLNRGIIYVFYCDAMRAIALEDKLADAMRLIALEDMSADVVEEKYPSYKQRINVQILYRYYPHQIRHRKSVLESIEKDHTKYDYCPPEKNNFHNIPESCTRGNTGDANIFGGCNGWNNDHRLGHVLMLTIPPTPEDSSLFSMALSDYEATGLVYPFTVCCACC